MSEWKCDVCGRGLESCTRNNAGELVHICLGCKPEDFKVIPDWILKVSATGVYADPKIVPMWRAIADAWPTGEIK